MWTVPYGPAQLCAWTYNTPLDRAGATARRHHPNPAEAHRRWRGRGASRSGSVSVITTHALFAPKVQRKVSNGVAGLAAGGASLDRQKSRANSCLTAMPLDGQRRRRTLAGDPGSTRPERHFPSGAAQTRIVSAARIRLDSWKSLRTFKGIICGDISEFGVLPWAASQSGLHRYLRVGSRNPRDYAPFRDRHRSTSAGYSCPPIDIVVVYKVDRLTRLVGGFRQAGSQSSSQAARCSARIVSV